MRFPRVAMLHLLDESGYFQGNSAPRIPYNQVDTQRRLIHHRSLAFDAGPVFLQQRAGADARAGGIFLRGRGRTDGDHGFALHQFAAGPQGGILSGQRPLIETLVLPLVRQAGCAGIGKNGRSQPLLRRNACRREDHRQPD